MKTRLLATAALCFAASLSSCDEDILVAAPCTEDANCGAGQICEVSECVPASAVSCASVDGGTPLLQPDPSRITFDTSTQGLTELPIVLRNVGSCTLTIFEAYLEKGEDSPFTCTGCEEGLYPHEIFPMRVFQLSVAYNNQDVGEFHDNLILVSDDAEFGEIKLPLSATFEGRPTIRVLPDPVEFGYVATGRPAIKRVAISNAGEGTATVGITEIRVEPAEDSPFSLPTPAVLPITLAPLVVDSASLLELEVKYQPREATSHTGELVIVTDRPEIGIVRIALSGTSESPPEIHVSPESLQFGEVNLGQIARTHVTIQNEGGSPLTITQHWEGGVATDLSVSPAVVPDVAPGGFVELQVLAAPSAEGPIGAILILETNDPSRPSVAIPVSAEGHDLGQAVLKVELNFENGDDGTFDDDLRNVDMTLENPFGLVCNQQEPDPATWADFGEPHWLQLGPKGEPERVVLIGAQRNGTYKVLLTYAEDCSFMPSGLLASILGISGEILIGYITGGVVGGIGDDISDAIDNACFSHSGSAAQITVSINGVVVGEKTVHLGRKGDYLYAMDLVYLDGVFTLR